MGRFSSPIRRLSDKAFSTARRGRGTLRGFAPVRQLINRLSLRGDSETGGSKRANWERCPNLEKFSRPARARSGSRRNKRGAEANKAGFAKCCASAEARQEARSRPQRQEQLDLQFFLSCSPARRSQIRWNNEIITKVMHSMKIKASLLPIFYSSLIASILHRILLRFACLREMRRRISARRPQETGACPAIFTFGKLEDREFRLS